MCGPLRRSNNLLAVNYLGERCADLGKVVTPFVWHPRSRTVVIPVGLIPTKSNCKNSLSQIRAITSPPTAVETTTSHGGSFQKANNPKARIASPKSTGLKIALVHTGL